MSLTCNECSSNDIEPADGDDCPPFCRECGSEDISEAASADQTDEALPKYHNMFVGRVIAADAVAGKNLTRCVVDVGDGREVTICTNAKHIESGITVVVALVGAVIGDLDNDGFKVAKTSVGGVMSEGVLCDCPMLGWSGGAAGAAVKLSADDYKPGDTPPSERPRPQR